MLTPMRSLTLAQGLKPSSFAATLAAQPSVTWFKYTSGVFPINSVTSLAIFTIGSESLRRVFNRNPLFDFQKRCSSPQLRRSYIFQPRILHLVENVILTILEYADSPSALRSEEHTSELQSRQY